VHFTHVVNGSCLLEIRFAVRKTSGGQVMDELQRATYVERFRLAFHTQKGTTFQDFFVRLAGHAFGADFEEVRPYGPQGDLK
jgi:hypothetical protein